MENPLKVDQGVSSQKVRIFPEDQKWGIVVFRDGIGVSKLIWEYIQGEVIQEVQKDFELSELKIKNIFLRGIQIDSFSKSIHHLAFSSQVQLANSEVRKYKTYAHFSLEIPVLEESIDDSIEEN